MSVLFLSKCSIQLLGLDKQRVTRIYKNIIICFNSSTVTLVWSRRAIWESSRTRRSCRESKQPAGTDFKQNSWPYKVLKLTRDPHTMLVFRWSLFTPTHCLLFIAHGFYPHSVCFPVITVIPIRPDVSVNNICRVYRRSRWYITQEK